ncbi:hypothetical protein [Devosia sp.]|uniref:hypothetical protein n=1 Tax=Devosia sp. TaxID=1871048 RepID=UPI0025D4E2CA|nr:hypothetical protein [Devosia sp.]MCR6634915.1 hypothetical protein [Devosia sp.]
MWTQGDNRQAVEGLAVSIHFSSEMPPLLALKVRDRARSVAAGLGLGLERTIFEVDVNDDGESSSTETGKVFLSADGISEDRRAAGHFHEMLSIEDDKIIYRTAAFEGWAVARERFVALMVDILSQVKEVMELRTIRLEVRYRFFWEGARSDWDFSPLLRTNSPYIAPFVYETSEPWHSNSGKWLPRTSTKARLLQTNVQANHWRNSFNDRESAGLTMRISVEDRIRSSGIEVSDSAYDMVFTDLDKLHEDMQAASEEIIVSEFLRDAGSVEAK